MFIACLALPLAVSACSESAQGGGNSDRDAAVATGSSGAADGGEVGRGGDRADSGSSTAVSAGSAADEPKASSQAAAGSAADASGAVVDGEVEPSAPTAIEGSLDIHELSQRLAAAVCASLLDCLGQQKLRAFVDDERCEARFAAGFEQQDFATLHDSVRRGRVEVHADRLEQCYEDTRALGCAIQTERLPSACQEALKGSVAEGATCSIGADCAGDTYCPTTECPRVCTARGAESAGCVRDEECVAGLICVKGQCAAPADLTQACAGTSSGVCALGASCVGSTKDEAGRCAANSEVQVGELGDVCTPGATLCREGLSCAYDGASGFTCQGAKSSGEACHLALPTMCPEAEYCTASDVTSEGSCAPLPTDGEACVLGSECAGGHVCLAGADDGVTCARLRDLGESCSQAAMCRSGRCERDQCVVAEVCD